MTDDLKELQELQPQSSFIIVKGESFEIKPFKFKHMFAVLNHISNMIDEVNPYEDQTKQLFKLLGKHPDDVMGILGLALGGKPVSFFDDVDTEQGIDLAILVWKINKDFFAQKVQPKMKELGLFQDLPEEQENSVSEKKPLNESEASPQKTETENQ